MSDLKHLRFPKRFEVEDLDPFKLKVKIAFKGGEKIFENLEEAAKEFKDFEKLYGPMACQINGNWCVRFETQELYNTYD